MRILFMGTSIFGASTLKNLILSEHSVAAVFTKEPKAASRGMKISKTPIHEIAEEYKIPVFTPKTLKSLENIEIIQCLKPDIVALVAYGLIVPQAVLDIPKYCCINLHPSKLPRWRGAAPVERTVMAGDTETAICVMRMDAGLDTGPIILQRNMPVNDSVTAATLASTMAEIGGHMMLEAINLINNNKASFLPQSQDGITYAHKITQEETIVDWNNPAYFIHCAIRAFSPKPGMTFKFNNESIKIIASQYISPLHVPQYIIESQKHNSRRVEINNFNIARNGTVLNDELAVKCGDGGLLLIQQIQRPGGKILDVRSFLNGYRPLKLAVLA